jgi:hypothetical protein
VRLPLYDLNDLFRLSNLFFALHIAQRFGHVQLILFLALSYCISINWRWDVLNSMEKVLGERRYPSRGIALGHSSLNFALYFDFQHAECINAGASSDSCVSSSALYRHSASLIVYVVFNIGHRHHSQCHAQIS